MRLSRRALLSAGGALGVAAALPSPLAASQPVPADRQARPLLPERRMALHPRSL
jgi:uncharacterized protein (DUF1501 family)